MADRAHGWTTVGHGSRGQGFDRAWEVELESRERQTIALWHRNQLWPSIDRPLCKGADAKRFDARLIKLEDLGYGSFGIVQKVIYDAVPLARKRIACRRTIAIESLRQEGLTMRKLDHHHVVKLVATYSPAAQVLCLLLWPVAVCNLGVLLEDVECLRLGEGDGEDIIKRLEALHLASSHLVSGTLAAPTPTAADAECPLDYLRTVIGCVARAMAHCHEKGVRHLDIKPSNILLKPQRVYLADFGISKDVSGQDHTTTDGLPGTEKWRAPELYGGQGSSMQLADIYSLGLVYLKIATILYTARLADFEEALNYPPRLLLEDGLRIRAERIKLHLDRLACQASDLTYEGLETVRPRPVVGLISKMIASNPVGRMPAERIDKKLSSLGGIRQVYHGHCCKRPAAWIEDKWDRKLAALTSLRRENERLRQRTEELEGMDRTYEARLANSRKAHEQDIARLKARLKEAPVRFAGPDSNRPFRSPKQARADGDDGPRARAFSAKRDGAPMASTVPVSDGPNMRPSASSAARLRMQGRASESSSTRTAGDGGLASSLSRPREAALAALAPTARPRPTSASTGGRTGPGGEQPARTTKAAADFQLPLRVSGSRLPLPVTASGKGTPNRSYEASMSGSSISSSILSRRSLETVPTSARRSPIPGKSPSPAGALSPLSTAKRRRKQVEANCFPGADAASAPAVYTTPSLQPTKSWAEVAGWQ